MVSSADDGIYILVKEVLDNSIDEYVMGAGKNIEISIQGSKVTIRDFGRGIPLGKVVDVVSKMNTGGKYDSKAFKKSVGLNGVGTKAVNALSSFFRVESSRDGKICFCRIQSRKLRATRFFRGKFSQERDESIIYSGRRNFQEIQIQK